MKKQTTKASGFDKIFEDAKKTKRKTDPSFYDRVYDVVRCIPKGKVTSYGAIGEALGLRSSARLVGHAMGAVPEELDVPAHRVVNRTGALTGSHKFGGYDKMRWLLEKDGVTFRGERVDMKNHFWQPSGKG